MVDYLNIDYWLTISFFLILLAIGDGISIYWEYVL